MAMDGESIGVPADLLQGAGNQLDNPSDFQQNTSGSGDSTFVGMDINQDKPWITSLSSAGGGQYLPPTGSRQALAERPAATTPSTPTSPTAAPSEGNAALPS